MFRIYLIRHGETEYNRRRIIQGYAEIPLSDLGIQQADRLARRMSRLPLDAIYTSDLRRTTMTACLLAARTGAPLHYDSTFRERNPGDLTHETYEVAHAFFNDPDFDPPAGESVPVFEKRVVRAFADLARREEGRGRRVAIVTHGMVCGTFLRRVVGMSEEELAQIQWRNTSLSILDYNGGWNPILLSDASHLEGLDDGTEPHEGA